MSFPVACPNCDASYRLPESLVGRTARCRKCGDEFVLSREAGEKGTQGHDLDTGTDGTPQVPAQTPECLGRFEIRERLGAGAFGSVYRAWDPLLERLVALKVPHPGMLSDEENKQRYLREPKAAAKLRHPNIVPVFDASLDGENLYIASACVDGRTLEETMAGRQFRFTEVASLIRKLALSTMLTGRALCIVM